MTRTHHRAGDTPVFSFSSSFKSSFSLFSSSLLTALLLLPFWGRIPSFDSMLTSFYCDGHCGWQKCKEQRRLILRSTLFFFLLTLSLDVVRNTVLSDQSFAMMWNFSLRHLMHKKRLDVEFVTSTTSSATIFQGLGKFLRSNAKNFPFNANCLIPGSFSKGLASYCKAETTFTFHFSIINAYESIWQY